MTGAAAASVVEALELDELVAQSTHIVVGRVSEQQSRWDQRRRIVTDVAMRVEDVMKGSHRAGEMVIVTVLGGAVGEIGLHVPGEPTFNDGERVLLFARESVDGTGALRPVGMSQGVMRLNRPRDGGSTMVVPGGEGLVTVDGARPSAAWLTSGESRPSARPLPDVLDEIRQLVRARDRR
jgi:hypothetical protein